MKYLLDTHVWIWMNSSPENLSTKVTKTLNTLKKNDQLLLSSISLWEVCKLVEKGKITLYEDLEKWIDEALDIPGLKVISLNFNVFFKSTTLPPPFHNDPADQMIAATARIENATLITKDKKLLNYHHIKTVW